MHPPLLVSRHHMVGRAKIALKPNANVSFVGMALVPVRGQESDFFLPRQRPRTLSNDESVQFGPCVRTYANPTRCYRLDKECRPSPSARRVHSKKPLGSKTARIEERLNDIVSLLKSGKQSSVVGADAQTDGFVDVDSPSHSTGLSLPILTPGVSESTNSSTSPRSVHDAPEPSQAAAEEFLASYRTTKMNYFPVVYIPPATTAQQLREEKPFLWLCIMSVASTSVSQQQALSEKVRQVVGEEMVQKSEKTIDLLLGLVTFLGWISYHVHKPSLSLFTRLATSLVFDLGLNQPIHRYLPPAACIAPIKYPAPRTAPRTTEERRAVLGCFLITSM